MSTLAVTCSMSSPTGTLNLESGLYELERASLEEVATTWRKQEVDNPWVEGSFVIGAVRNNVVRPLNVWVTSPTQDGLKTALTALTDALGQLSYTLTFGVDGVLTTWRCSMADYTIRQEQGFRFARTALVSAQVPTKPTAIG